MTASSFAERYMIGTIDVTLGAQHLTYVEMEMLGLLPDTPGVVSFCVVRNPYDRALSSVMHFDRGDWTRSQITDERRDGFERSLECWLKREPGDHNLRAHRRCQIDFLRDRKGHIAVDHILRFEFLDQDFKVLRKHLGWNGLEVGKVGDSGRHLGYREYYTDRAKDLVDEFLGEDVELFEYEF